MLVHSLPILEDFTVLGLKFSDSDDDCTYWPSTAPPLTGALELYLTDGMEPVTRRLLELPNGVHFQKLECTLFLDDDIRCTTAMVEECSDTLESVKIECADQCEYHPSSLF